MKIFVVTPSYNQGQFIEDAIQSVLDQHYENFEHIIIDGGSSDNTLNVLKKHPYLKWISEPDKGQSDAINKGVLESTSDWILWLNADDFILPNTFSKLVEIFNRFPDINFIYGYTYFWDEARRKNTKCFHIPFHVNFTYFGIYSLPSTGSFIKSTFSKEIF